MLRPIFFCAVLASIGPAALADTWTASDGQRTINAEFAGLEGNQISLRMPSGEVTSFDITLLSPEDQERARSLAPENGSAESAEGSEGGEPTEVQEQFEGHLEVFDRSRLSRFDFSGTPEYFILYYSASWCGPCRELAPHSKEFYDETIAADPRVELIMISSDRNEGASEDWAEEVGMPWPILPAAESENVPVAVAHSPQGIPHMVLVDGEGNEIASGRVQQMEQALAGLE